MKFLLVIIVVVFCLVVVIFVSVEIILILGEVGLNCGVCVVVL